MIRIFVSGLGVVSPAGWGLASFRHALREGVPLPKTLLQRPGAKPLQVRLVPPTAAQSSLSHHPRLRRASPITQYAAAAAVEAVAALQLGFGRRSKLGLVVCHHSGCVQYSCRFFEEILRDPTTASPLVFPETVFAAPASHIAHVLGQAERVSTLVGDPACFVQGLGLAAEWLADGSADGMLVVGAEETHWVLADALWRFQHAAIFSSGAGAICLTRDERFSMGLELQAITDSQTYSTRADRVAAARAMRAQLPPGSPGDLLCDGLDSSPRADAAERLAWQAWAGARLSLKKIFGEGLMAAAAWQCVAACDAVAQGPFDCANVSLVGCNQQAIGARFARATKTPPANSIGGGA